MYSYFIQLTTDIQIEILKNLYTDLTLLAELRKCAKVFDRLYQNEYLWFRIMSLKYPHFIFKYDKPLLSSWKETGSEYIEELQYPMSNLSWKISQSPSTCRICDHDLLFRGPIIFHIPYFYWEFYYEPVKIDKDIITESEIIETISKFYHQEIDLEKLTEKVSDIFSSLESLAYKYDDNIMLEVIAELRRGQKKYHYQLYNGGTFQGLYLRCNKKLAYNYRPIIGI